MAAFPSGPVNGQQATVNGILYTYDSGTKSWTRVQGVAGNITSTGTIAASALATGTLNANSTATVNALTSNGAVSGTTGTFTTSTTTSALNTGTLNANSTATVNALTSNGAIIGTTGTFGSGVITTTLNANANITVTNLTVNTNATISSNIVASNYVISGTGIFYSNGTAFSSGGTSFKTYTSDTAPPASGNVTGDQWYNTANDVVYEWQYDGTSYYWVDITSSALTVSQTASLGNLDISNNLTVGNSITVTGNVTAGNLISNSAVRSTSVTTGSITSGAISSNANVTANGLTVNNSATVGTSLSVTGNIVSTGGNLLIGGTAVRGTTAGTAHIDIFNGTAPAGTLTNGISLYSSSGDFQFMDSGGNAYKVGYRNLPAVGTKTGSYTLATTDVGKYVQVGTGGSITIPDATFAEGDIVSIFNNTSGSITITCSITTAYISGTDSDKATMTLATRGVATVFFISGTVCVVAGSVT